jgi:hypothetical protein
MRIIPRSNLPQTRNNIIQKGLAFGREQSGTVTVPGTRRARDPAPPAVDPHHPLGGVNCELAQAIAFMAGKRSG